MLRIPVTYPQPISGGFGKIGISSTNKIVENTNESADPDPNKPLLATEVFSRLRNIGWGKLDGRFVKGENRDKLWYRRYKYGSDMPEYEVDAVNLSAVKTDSSGIGFPISYEPGDIYPETVHTINTLYSEIFGEYDAGQRTIIFTSTLKNKIASSGPEYIDVILPDYDVYTNLVNIRDLIKYSSRPGIKATVDIVINFSKENNIFIRCLSFTAFKYGDDGKLIQEDLVFDLGEVELSYSDGIIEVIPVSSEVKEYIIDKCTIKYGEF